MLEYSFYLLYFSKMFSVILLAAGIGSRTGKNRPKQYCMLGGKTLLSHCVEAVIESKMTEELVLTYGPGYKETLCEFMEPYSQEFKKITYVEGGETRQKSVYNALKACTGESVILHESARPLITAEDLKNIASHPDDAVTTGCAIPFTVLKTSEGYLCEVLKRDELVNIQLPQKFPLQPLLKAHGKAEAEFREFTDDSSLYFYYHGKVAVTEGSTENIKVTDAKDFPVAEAVLKRRSCR